MLTRIEEHCTRGKRLSLVNTIVEPVVRGVQDARLPLPETNIPGASIRFRSSFARVQRVSTKAFSIRWCANRSTSVLACAKSSISFVSRFADALQATCVGLGALNLRLVLVLKRTYKVHASACTTAHNKRLALGTVPRGTAIALACLANLSLRR